MASLFFPVSFSSCSRSFYSRAPLCSINMRESLYSTGIAPSPELAQLVCKHCSQLLVPGVNCTVRVQTRLRRRAAISAASIAAIGAAANMSTAAAVAATSSAGDLHTPKAARLSKSAAGALNERAARRIAAAVALPGAVNQIAYSCLTCGSAPSVNTTSATPRAWRAVDALRRRQAAQSTSARKKRLQHQLRHSNSTTPVAAQPSFGSAAITPKAGASVAAASTPKNNSLLFQFQCDDSNAGARARSDAAPRPGTSVAQSAPSSALSPPVRQIPPMASSAAAASPALLLEQRARELKKSKKAAAAAAAAGGGGIPATGLTGSGSHAAAAVTVAIGNVGANSVGPPAPPPPQRFSFNSHALNVGAAPAAIARTPTASNAPAAGSSASKSPAGFSFSHVASASSGRANFTAGGIKRPAQSGNR